MKQKIVVLGIVLGALVLTFSFIGQYQAAKATETFAECYFNHYCRYGILETVATSTGWETHGTSATSDSKHCDQILFRNMEAGKITAVCTSTGTGSVTAAFAISDLNPATRARTPAVLSGH